MRTVVAVLLAAALGVSSAFLVACGDRNSLIPKDEAALMQSDLDQASSLYEQEECRAAQAQVRQAEARAQALPSGVDSELRAKLRENLDTVLQRIVDRCGRTRTQTTPTQTQTTATTPTETTHTTTETTHTETTTEPPTTTTEPAPAPQPPADPGQSGGTRPGSGGSGSGQ